VIVEEQSLSWEQAGQMARRACEYAVEQGLKVCVWVLDRHGNPLAMQRINHAPMASSGIARDKAFTAASFGFGTHLWQSRLASKPHLLSGLSQRDELVLFGGGLPLYYLGQLVGAIGVSGASEEQDQACARAGLETFPELTDTAE